MIYKVKSPVQTVVLDTSMLFLATWSKTLKKGGREKRAFRGPDTHRYPREINRPPRLIWRSPARASRLSILTQLPEDSHKISV